MIVKTDNSENNSNFKLKYFASPDLTSITEQGGSVESNDPLLISLKFADLKLTELYKLTC